MNKMKRRFSFLILAALLASISVADAASVERSNSLGQNLLTYSEQMENAAWVKNGASTILTDNTSDTLDPMGGSHAVKWVYDGTGAVNALRFGQAYTYIAGKTYTISFWAKATTARTVLWSSTLNEAKFFTVTTSWQRYTFTFVSTGGSGYFSFYMNTGDNDPLTAYFYGAQLVRGSFAGAYNRTGSSVLNSTFVPTGSKRSNQLGQNLLVNSQVLTGYSGVGSPSVSATPNAGIAPDGTNTMTNVVPFALAGNKWIYQILPGVFTATGPTKTVSIYAKANGYNWIGVGFGSGALADGAFFNLSTGVIGTVASGKTAKIIPVGNGIYRVSVTGIGQLGTGYALYQPVPADATALDFTGDGTSGVLMWGAQAVLGSSPAAYNPTTASARNATFVPQGAVKSNQLGQNLIKNSETLDASTWAKTAATVTSNTTPAPNGEMTGDRMTDTTATNVHALSQLSLPTVAGRIYTFSAYFKYVSHDLIVLAGNGGDSTAFVYVNAQTGTIAATEGANQLSSGIVSVGGGWYRAWNTFLANNNATGPVLYYAQSVGVVSYAGTGTDSMDIWGVQHVEGRVPAAYNPTVASTLNPSYVP